jgi:hypothetical protein
MMAQFSPLTRRVVALGIAILLVFGLVNLVLVPIYNLTAGSLSGLEDARFQNARLEAIAARPLLPRSEPVPSSLYLVAPDRQRAMDALIAAIGTAASRYEIQLDSVTPSDGEAGRSGTIMVSITARGEHDKMLAWINELERGAPAIYFPEWSLGAGEGPAAPVGGPPPAEGAPSPLAPAPAAAAQSGPLLLTLNAKAVLVWEQGS